MKPHAISPVIVLLLSICGFFPPASHAQTDSEEATRLVGTWEYVRSESLQDDGTWKETLAAPARIGVIMYTASGRMAVQIMLRDRGASGGYTAYFGTYDINAQEGFVTHHRAGHLNPDNVGDDAKRFYAFSGDRLTLTVAPARRNRLTWRRIP